MVTGVASAETMSVLIAFVSLRSSACNTGRAGGFRSAGAASAFSDQSKTICIG